MPNHISTCRIRLDGKTNGTGFLIADGYVLTCTHVVQAAIDDAEIKITVSFQRSDDKKEIPATVSHFTPLDDNKDYRDIAVLALSEANGDAKVIPLPLNHQSELAKHPFATCGFRHDIGEITTGIIAENENNSLMQLNFGDIPIVQGYSGAPVWAEKLDAVVGMVTWSMTENTAYCISIRYIADIWENEFKLPALPEIFSHNPYKGLDYFHTADADRFYGRDEEIARLYETIQQQHFIAVMGNSGTGKSSVVFAGLVPKLDEAAWCVLATRPADDPFHYLAKALVDHFEKDLSDLKKISEIKDYKAKLQQGSLTLADVATMEKDSRARQLVLIIDQFEELYTLNQDKPDDVQAYLEHLMAAIASQKLRIIITLRTDFLSNTHQTPDFAKLIEANKHNIYLIKEADKLAHIITLPDAQGRDRVQLEAGLKEKIIEDAKGELALLQFALEELWQRRENNSLTHAAYTAIGGVDGALERKAENFMETLPKEEQQQVRLIMLKLLKLGEGTEDTRRIATKAEIGEDNWLMVSRLADQRLVKTKSEKGEETAEVIHEVLIRNWTTLDTWLTKDVREFLRWHDGLRAQFKTWQESGQPRSGLLTGLQLVKAEDYVENIQQAIDSPTNLLSESELNYIEQSARRAKSKKNRTVLAALAMLIMALLITSRITLLGNSLDSAREISQLKDSILAANELSEQGLEIFTRKDWQFSPPGYPVIGMLMMLEAKKLSDNYQYQSTQVNSVLPHVFLEPLHNSYLWLHSEITVPIVPLNDNKLLVEGNNHSINIWDFYRKTIVATFEGYPDNLTSIETNIDNEVIAAAGENGIIMLWDRKTQQHLHTLSLGRGKIHDLAFNPQNTLLASAHDDGTIGIWDFAEGKLLYKLTKHQDAVRNLIFHPNSHILISSGNDSKIFLWDLGTETIELLEKHTEAIFSMAVSPNGNHLASRTSNGTLLWNLNDLTLEPQKVSGNVGITGDGSLMKGGLAFSADSKILAIGTNLSNNGDPILWDIDGGKDSGIRIHNVGLMADIGSLAFSSNGNVFLGFSPYQPYILVVNLNGTNDDVLRKTVSPIYSTSRIWATNSFAFSPDGESVFMGSNAQGEISQLILEKDTTRAVFSGEPFMENYYHDIKISDNNSILAYKSQNQNIVLWDFRTNTTTTVKHSIKNESGAVSMAISPNGEWLVLPEMNCCTIHIWNLQNKKHYLLTGDSGVRDVVFSSDGKKMITGQVDGRIIFWTWVSDRWYRTKVIDKLSTIMELDTSGNLLAISTMLDVTVWDLKTGKEILSLSKYSDSAGDISLNHDHTLIALIDGNHIYVKNLRTGKEILDIDLFSFTELVNLKFHPKEDIIAFQTSSDTLMFFNINMDIWIQRICQYAGRNLFKAEWGEYFSTHPETWEDYVARGGTCPQYPVLENIEGYANLDN